ncbi:exodeoxyribonuclease VII large subunit [Roseibacillus ishigakijimensis]|uniref:Exodeoxyribonuclease 7 large subunit n=1 Tax=Roseibacillus ishigakijimensis TaxID=454146 RepID=A0A934RRT7_9BACT|nr:exodeoxyribonuclease VII large subunit [Roseibacillus ishigakijimensis]MBK1833361.1 exodeoxyribonuclease VII large subunit [Roseibacillus ishigakijimensis]
MNLFTDFPSDREEKREALPVSRLLRRMRNLLEIEIGEVWVEGEVSNLRKQKSGHWYFTLKDDQGQIACAMFGARRRNGNEVLEDGAKVRVFGEVTIYEARGTAQLVVKEAEAVGEGGLQARFEALKRKLDAEGLFAAGRKKPLPKHPTRLALVTSGSGAALQDMLNVLSRRAPWVTVYLADVQVQGKGAEQGIARAIERLGNWQAEGWPECEVIIVARGGGSLEDLWNFNEEVVARAIAACPLPVVSAVGHEIDFTIADFVADLRAPTPSAAAELVVPDQKELATQLEALQGRLRRRLREELQRRQETLRHLRRTGVAVSPEKILREPVRRLDEAAAGLERAAEGSLRRRRDLLHHLRRRWQVHHPRLVMARRRERLERLQRRLDLLGPGEIQRRRDFLTRLESVLRALGPDSAFERGFSITRTQEGKILHHPGEAAPGELIETVFKDGSLLSRVEKE